MALFTRVEAADAAYARAHWDEAGRLYEAVIERVPEDAYAWFRLGNVRVQQGHLGGAIEAYQAALAREPGWAKLYYNLSTVYVLQAREVLLAGEGHANARERARMRARQAVLEEVLYESEDVARGRVRDPGREQMLGARGPE